MGKTLRFEGSVSTRKVGSQCSFEFEVNEDDLPADAAEREEELNRLGLDAMWESGIIDWSIEQVGEEP